MNIKEKIIEKIIEHDKIIITRHIRPDGDCVCGSIGLREMIKLSFPEKTCHVLADDYIDYLDFLGKEDEEKDEEFYKDALVIVVDTASKNRISNKFISSFHYVIKIDHHLETDPYGDLNWVCDSKSSASELIVDLYLENSNLFKLNKEIATILYIGIISDNGRFRYEQTTADTLRSAAVLMDFGIDLEYIFSKLYLKTYENFKFTQEIQKKIKTTKNGVLYLHITKDIQEKYNLNHSEASAVVNLMDSVKGSLIWIAFIDNEDSTIRVRLRSRFASVNQIGELFNGGGHRNASGATLESKEEIKKVLKIADLECKNYKKNNGECE